MRQSGIETYEVCPFQYDLIYNQELEVLKDQDPQNALYLGTAIHYGCETRSIDAAIENYISNYYAINDLHENEIIKLRHWLSILIPTLPDNAIHEEYFEHKGFHGTGDMLVPNDDGTFDLYDFKYSNNIERYKEKKQLHIYKHFLSKKKFTVNKLFYIFIPKTFIRQKKTESIGEFRIRLRETLKTMEIKTEEIPFDQEKVHEALETSIEILETKEFEKTPNRLCDWCDYKKYCKEGIDYMLLPKNERVEVAAASYMKGWIYGAPFSGKTTFLDNAPSPLNLNTDGNTKYVTMQRLRIRDEVTVEGRITKRKFAWEVFKDAIAELEKGSDFETIIVDLLEDTREMCRVYMYDKLNIQHESDSGYGKGWDIIKTEYLTTMRRLFNLDYNIFVLSHEDVSKDLTKNSGEKITRIAPNIQEAIANKVAGMVDFVARVVVNDDGTRTLSFKTNEVIFGGGRLNIEVGSIALDWNELMSVYEEANEKAGEKVKAETKKRTSTKKKETVAIDSGDGEKVEVELQDNETNDLPEKEEKPKRGRKKKEKANVATETSYFEHEGSGSFVKVEKGESLDFLDTDIFDKRTEGEYEKWVRENEQSETHAEEKPTRRRRRKPDAE